MFTITSDSLCSGSRQGKETAFPAKSETTPPASSSPLRKNVSRGTEKAEPLPEMFEPKHRLRSGPAQIHCRTAVWDRELLPQTEPEGHAFLPFGRAAQVSQLVPKSMDRCIRTVAPESALLYLDIFTGVSHHYNHSTAGSPAPHLSVYHR